MCVCVCIVWVLICSLFGQKECVCVFRTAGGRFIRLNAGFMVQLKKGLGAFPPVLGPPHSHVKTPPSCSSDKGMKCVTRYTVTQAVLFTYCACSVYHGVCLNILFCWMYRWVFVFFPLCIVSIVFMERGSGLELCVRQTHTVWTYGALTAIDNLILQ